MKGEDREVGGGKGTETDRRHRVPSGIAGARKEKNIANSRGKNGISSSSSL